MAGFAEPWWNEHEVMTSPEDPRLELDGAIDGQPEPGDVEAAPAPAYLALFPPAADEGPCHELDLSQHENYETTERGTRFAIGLGCMAGVWAFFQIFAALILAMNGGTSGSRILVVGTLFFGLCMAMWGVLGGARAITTGPGGLIDQVWDLLNTRRPAAPAQVLDGSPAERLREQGRPADALIEYQAMRRQYPGLPIVIFRMAEIQRHDLHDADAAQRLYREFLLAVRHSKDEDELRAADRARLQIQELDRG